MASLGSLVISLTAETARFREDMNRASSIAQRNFRTIENAAKSAAGVLIAGFGAAGVGGVFQKMVAEQEEAQRALARTNAVLNATGNAIGRSATALLDQARELNLATLLAEDEIRRGQQILLSYSNIVGNNFDQALEISADLATLMGTSLPSAVETFAKALDNPVERISSLTRIGFNFTEQQKETIKQLVESNRLFEAQNIILDVAQRSFGGLARAEAEGYAGAQKQLTEAINESLEAFADQINLIENTTSFLRGLADAITSTTAFIIENRTALLAWAAIFVGGALVAGLAKATAAVVAFGAAVAATAVAFAANPIALAILAITAAAVPAVIALNNMRKETEGLTISAQENEVEMRKLIRQQQVATGQFQRSTAVVKDNKKEMEKIAGILERQREAYQSLFLTKDQMTELDLKALGASKQQIADFRTLTEAINNYNREQERSREQTEQYNSLLDEYKSLYNDTASNVQKLADREAYLLNLQQRLIEAGYERAAVENLIAEARLNAADELLGTNKETEKGIKLNEQLGQAIGTAFEDAILKASSFKDILKGLEQDIIRIILRQTITKPLEGFIGNILGGGGGAGGGVMGSVGSFISGFFGGPRALGGPVLGNRAYLVGEQGPELFMPSGAGSVTPMPAGGSMGFNVVNNFTISGPVDRRSQTQIAAAAGQGIQRAVGRNT